MIDRVRGFSHISIWMTSLGLMLVAGHLMAAPIVGTDFSTAGGFNQAGGSLDNLNVDDLDSGDGITVSAWSGVNGGAFVGFDANAQVGMPNDQVTKINGGSSSQPALGTLPATTEVQFTITIPSTERLDLTSISWDWRKATSSGNARWLAFRTSLDAGLIFSELGIARNAVDNETITFIDSRYKNLTDTNVTFSWLAGGEGTGDIDIDTIVVNGDVVDVATNAPTVNNIAPSNIQPTSATVGGEVTDTGGGGTEATLYWGSVDGGTVPGNWANVIPFGLQNGVYSVGISGLTPDTTYFFRSFGVNSAGDDWADSTAIFTTGGPPDPPVVVNASASDVTFTTATMNGAVTFTGGETPDVIIYFGDNDGGTTPGNWDDSVAIGAQSDLFSNSLFGLTHDTEYYYRVFAQNSGGSNWAPSTTNFITLAYGLPQVENQPATNVTGTAATIGGTVLSTGGDTPAVRLYYGNEDGGTLTGSWDNVVELGIQGGDFESVITGLNPLSTYHYRVYAFNEAGEAWAITTDSFTTLDLSELVINEFMAANDGGDSNNANGWYPLSNQVAGTTDDWIEILNTSTNTLDLGGWRLTNNPGDPTGWTFPPGTLLAGNEFLIVYASGTGMPDTNGNLHVNFRLNADGEYLGLVRPAGTIASEFGPGGSNYPRQDNDVSYGIHPGSSMAVYFDAPTPGAPNDINGLARVADTRFSPGRGYYQGVTNVTMQTDTLGATIYYTTNGLPPVDLSGTPDPSAVVYTGPVTVNRTVSIRAAAVKAGFAPAEVETHSYILLNIDGANPDGTDAAGLNTPFLEQVQPPGWGNLSSGDFNMDTDISKSTDGTSGHPGTVAQTMLLGMRDIPTISVAMNRDDFSGGNGIYSNSQDANLEHPCSAEFIPAIDDLREDWQINCGIKVQGGASRNPSRSPKHSLNFRFRTQYGPGRLRQPLFSGSEVETFNTIALRAGYNNSWIHSDSNQRSRGSMIRDQWMRECMLDMGNPAAGQGFMVHLFINGLYWGVHNLCERPEASHYAAYNGGDDAILDANNGGSVVDGNSTAFNAMKAVVADVGATNYWARVQSVIDIDHYIDYQIINRYGANADLKTGGNWRSAGGGPFPSGQPELMARWQLYSWDGERVLESPGAANSPIDPFAVRGTLENNEEYRIRFADRLYKHFFNGGAMTPAACQSRWMKYANALDRAIIAESARWGDHRGNPPRTRDDDWLVEQNRLNTTYFPGRSSSVFDAYGSLFPDTDVPVFEVNSTPQHGGEIPSNGVLSITTSSGTIYYTLDGSDPRSEGGGIAGSAFAIASGDDVVLPGSGRVRVRALDNGEWSALSEATFYVEPLAVPGDLAITEIHYNPYRADAFENEMGAGLSAPRMFDNADDFEFLELCNIAGHPVNLDGLALATGINFTFPEFTLSDGACLVIVKDLEAFGVRYPGVIPIGAYAGNLDDGGERITLLSHAGAVMVDIEYGSEGAWPGRADGNGSSLELVDSAGSDDGPDRWRSSSEFNGSPGSLGLGADNRVVINEVRSNPEGAEGDAVELYNTTAAPLDISGWLLSDDNGMYRSFTLPTTNLSAGAFAVFDETDFNRLATNVIGSYNGILSASPTMVNIPGHELDTGDVITIAGYGGISSFNDSFEITVLDADHVSIDAAFLDNHPSKGAWTIGRPFALNASLGDDLWLLEADAQGRPVRFVDRVDFAAAFAGETLGRWPNGSGGNTLVPMASVTLGATNLAPRVGPVILSEVMYQPLSVADVDMEFVEICNTGPVAENLANWRLRGGVDFDFGSQHSLPAYGGLLIVVPFDPDLDTAKATAFRAAYSIDERVVLVGPFSDGPLGDDAGRVRLQRPDAPPPGEPGLYPQVTEDEVRYESASPWPAGPAGGGESLQRMGLDLFGNDSSSWVGASPTPGGRRMDYVIWAKMFFGPGNSTGSALSEDFDGDQIANGAEFALGLNPRVPDNGTGPVISYHGGEFIINYERNLLLEGVQYRTEMTTDLALGPWTALPNAPINVVNFAEQREASVLIDSDSRVYVRLVIDFAP